MKNNKTMDRMKAFQKLLEEQNKEKMQYMDEEDEEYDPVGTGIVRTTLFVSEDNPEELTLKETDVRSEAESSEEITASTPSVDPRRIKPPIILFPKSTTTFLVPAGIELTVKRITAPT